MSELQNKILTAEPVPCSTHPILYDETKCVGCNACVNICQVDILIPSPEKGKHPIVLYPGECYYCGACVMACPHDGAIRLEHPLMNHSIFCRNLQRKRICKRISLQNQMDGLGKRPLCNCHLEQCSCRTCHCIGMDEQLAICQRCAHPPIP